MRSTLVRAFGSCEWRSSLTGLRAKSCDRLRAAPRTEREKARKSGKKSREQMPDHRDISRQGNCAYEADQKIAFSSARCPLDSTPHRKTPYRGRDSIIFVLRVRRQPSRGRARKNRFKSPHADYLPSRTNARVRVRVRDSSRRASSPPGLLAEPPPGFPDGGGGAARARGGDAAVVYDARERRRLRGARQRRRRRREPKP